MLFGQDKQAMPDPADALPGRPDSLPVQDAHLVLGTSLVGPYPSDMKTAMFGLGCFWGAERFFWQLDGVYTTAVGYAGGYTPNPLYEEVCSGRTGHNEVALVVYDPAVVSYDELLKVFWEVHDPTQFMRQGNDIGLSYRSAIYYVDEDQKAVAEDTIADVNASGIWPGRVVTELEPAGAFWEAEPEHQDYLERIPNGYTCHFPRPDWVLPKRAAE